MAKATYGLEKVDGRYYLHDGKKYALVDTGFGHTVSTDGTIGIFRVDKYGAEGLHRFNPTRMPDGSFSEAMLCPQTGYSCLLQNCDTITIDDDAKELPEHDWFIPYNMKYYPRTIVECFVEGVKKTMFFDTGMRMPVLDDASLLAGKRRICEIEERIGWKYTSATAPVYEATFEFPCGFQYEGHFEYDYSKSLMKDIFGDNDDKGFFGIEFFEKCDLFLSAIKGKEGIAVIRR